MSEKLKHCPFCGEKPIKRERDGETIASCHNTDCGIHFYGIELSQWNTRHADKPLEKHSCKKLLNVSGKGY